MTDMIPVSYKDDRPTVIGRDLHAALEIRTPYKDWFHRMCEYGFTEGQDFRSFLRESTGGRPATEHRITIDMAKEICMLQRSEPGRRYRQYFIELEKAWNTPDAIMARAHTLSEERIRLLSGENTHLNEQLAVQRQQIVEMKEKETYYNLVLMCKNTVPITVIAKEYGWSAKRINTFLHEQGVQFKAGSMWVLYEKYAHNGFTDTKTLAIPTQEGESFRAEIHTSWTQAGRLFIYRLMKDRGYLPVGQ